MSSRQLPSKKKYERSKAVKLKEIKTIEEAVITYEEQLLILTSQKSQFLSLKRYVFQYLPIPKKTTHCKTVTVYPLSHLELAAETPLQPL